MMQNNILYREMLREGGGGGGGGGGNKRLQLVLPFKLVPIILEGLHIVHW